LRDRVTRDIIEGAEEKRDLKRPEETRKMMLPIYERKEECR
jgi:hypothetical protein